MIQPHMWIEARENPFKLGHWYRADTLVEARNLKAFLQMDGKQFVKIYALVFYAEGKPHYMPVEDLISTQVVEK